MRIGILGTRGIPNHYGGFEELAEQLSVFLAKEGHEVYVYSSHNHPYQEQMFKGVNILHKKDPEGKMGTVGQFFYDLNCVVDARKRKFDVLLQLGYTSSSVWSFLMPSKAKLLTNMDGLEWKRAKYSNSVKVFLRRAEFWAARNSDVLIADAIGIQDYLLERFQIKASFIPYGAEIVSEFDKGLLEKYKAEGIYDLVVARMEPENNIESILKAYQGRSERLLMVGKTENQFAQDMQSQYASENIEWLGGVYVKEQLNALRHFSRFHFHGHSVGGTNPSLLEAMGCSARIVAHNNPFNREVLQENAYFFESHHDIIEILETPRDEVREASFISGNLERIRTTYNWEMVKRSYLDLMLEHAN